MKQKSVYEHSWEHPVLSVFRALQPLQCAACSRSIEQQELFTRSGSLSKHVGGLRYVLCSTCEPVSKRDPLLCPPAAARSAE